MSDQGQQRVEEAEAEQPQPAATGGKALASYESFEAALRQREAELATILPNHISRERFISVALAAVKQTPDLLNATPRSLFSSVTKAAQDGLLPDGREGVITVYNDKQKGRTAQWNPMAHGLRKKARELDRMLIDAQVVYANDTFVWHQGDEPRVEHVPSPLGLPRGDMIGAYAIFKREDGTILHREVMDKTQIETVKSQSRAQGSLMWTKFTEEAWRKTVLRRGIKSVPCSEPLDVMFRRDDILFDFDQTGQVIDTGRPERSDKNPFNRPAAARAEPEIVEHPAPPTEAPPASAEAPPPAETEPPQAAAAAPAPEQTSAQRRAGEFADWYADMEKQREACTNMRELNALHNDVQPQLEGEALRKWEDAYGVKASKILEATRRPGAKR